MARAGQDKNKTKKTGGKPAVGRERAAAAEAAKARTQPAETTGFQLWRALKNHAAGRFLLGLLGAAAGLGLLLLVAGDRFDLFYRIIGLLLLLTAGVFWFYFSLGKGNRSAAAEDTRPTDDGTDK